jgi:malate dehydrogenase (oxaloacetate-decarboxylating)(NADP+)
MASKGVVALRDPQLNMDNAFSADERQKLGIRGLLPPAVIPLDVLQKRTMMQFEKLATPLEKYSFLMALQVLKLENIPNVTFS